MPPRILVTNDDGYRSSAIEALARALRPLGEVVVVAPAREASGVSRALTLRSPLRLSAEGEGVHVVDGTPTDCVTLAVFHLMKEAPPSLVVSGINLGTNLGEDVNYSGTVAGAMEGATLGIPSLAFSQPTRDRDGQAADHSLAGRVARILAARVLEEGLPEGTLLNVNVPARTVRGFRVTRQGRRVYREVVEERKDPRGATYYWIAGRPEWIHDPESDHEALRAGYVSITPIRTDLTDHGSRERLLSWALETPNGLELSPT